MGWVSPSTLLFYWIQNLVQLTFDMGIPKTLRAIIIHSLWVWTFHQFNMLNSALLRGSQRFNQVLVQIRFRAFALRNFIESKMISLYVESLPELGEQLELLLSCWESNHSDSLHHKNKRNIKRNKINHNNTRIYVKISKIKRKITSLKKDFHPMKNCYN